MSVTRRRATLAAVCLALFLTMLDNTVVSVTLPNLQSDLHAGVSGLQWVVGGYILVFASLMLTGGTLGDLYGRRRLLLVGIVVFVAASVLAALAPSVGVLLVARFLQGAGAAACEPSTLSILRQIYPDRAERARAIGIWAGVSGLALALGPVVGGVLVGLFGWRGVFWFNVPFGLLCIAVTLLVVEDSADPGGRRVDLAGQALLALTLAADAYAVIEGNDLGWTSAPILALFVLAAAAGRASSRWSGPAPARRCGSTCSATPRSPAPTRWLSRSTSGSSRSSSS